MRVLLAIALGAVAAAVAVWWTSRESAPAAEAGSSYADPDTATAGTPPALYRWRDDAGVLQITDQPPKDRRYETVDVAGLERRNVFDPVPAGDTRAD